MQFTKKKGSPASWVIRQDRRSYLHQDGSSDKVQTNWGPSVVNVIGRPASLESVWATAGLAVGNGTGCWIRGEQSQPPLTYVMSHELPHDLWQPGEKIIRKDAPLSCLEFRPIFSGLFLYATDSTSTQSTSESQLLPSLHIRIVLHVALWTLTARWACRVNASANMRGWGASPLRSASQPQRDPNEAVAVMTQADAYTMLHRTNMSVRGLPVLFLGRTSETWPRASVLSLCVCSERERQEARGLGVGPWGAHWPPVTCKLINMPLSVTAQLRSLPHCWPALFSHVLWRELWATLRGWRDHTQSRLRGQRSSLESKVCPFVWRRSGRRDMARCAVEDS